MKKLLTSILVTWSLIAWSSVASAAGAQPLPEFLALKDNWSDLIGSSFRIEGHYTIATKNYVKFKNCELTFRSTKPIAKLRGNSRVIEVSGRLAKDGDGKPYFEIDSLKELPPDMQTLQERESQLARAGSKEWYDLAHWADERGRFYEDSELQKRAAALRLKGFHLERQEVKAVTPDALRTLARRAGELKLEAAHQWELWHEAFLMEWDIVRKAAVPVNFESDMLDLKTDPFFELLTRIDEQLPGANIEAKDLLPLLATEYRKNPTLSYRTATEASRRGLHRLLHQDIAVAAIGRWTNPDGSNGNQIAELILRWLPEQRERADQHRDAELTFLANGSAKLSRTQLNDLLLRLRDRKLEALAKETVTRWLTRREQSLRKDGVTGLIQLSDDVFSLTQDVRRSGALLLEALSQAPKNDDILERLKKLGFQETDGEWRLPAGATTPTERSFPVAGESDLERNIRLGVPMVGMTPAQLMKCLGAPQSVTRVATSGRITEAWTYREGAHVRHMITIERRPARGSASVVAVQ